MSCYKELNVVINVLWMLQIKYVHQTHMYMATKLHMGPCMEMWDLVGVTHVLHVCNIELVACLIK